VDPLVTTIRVNPRFDLSPLTIAVLWCVLTPWPSDYSSRRFGLHSVRGPLRPAHRVAECRHRLPYDGGGDIDGCGHYMQCGTKRTVNVRRRTGRRNTSSLIHRPRRAFGTLVVRDTRVPTGCGARIDCVVTACQRGHVLCASPALPRPDGTRSPCLISLATGQAQGSSLPLTVFYGRPRRPTFLDRDDPLRVFYA